MSRRLQLLAVVLIAAWMRLGVSVLAFPNDCANVCTSETTCTDTCYPDELAFINGNAITCLQWGTYGTPCCGDGTCSSGEDSSSCFVDCHCGDGTCNAGENTSTCPGDCVDPGGGGGPHCPNGTVDGNENCDSCVADCHTQQECGYCGDCICSAAEIGGQGTGNENHCNPNTSTWCDYCPYDCGACVSYTCSQSHLVCEDSFGKCRACYTNSECQSNEWCNVANGQCVPSINCTDDAVCIAAYGSTYHCVDNVCRPQL